MRWTAEDLRVLHALAAKGYGVTAIARRMRLPVKSVQNRLCYDRRSPESYAEGKRREKAKYRAKRAKEKPEIALRRQSEPKPDVPPAVMAEREAAITWTPTLTAAICGDPPPGRSALDRKRVDGGYDAQDDITKSLIVGYQAVKDRVAAGGPAWPREDA